MRKKFAKILMAVGIVISLAVAVNLTVNAATESVYSYTVSDGEVTITDCDETASGDIVIPSTLGGYPVTNIGEFAFHKCTSLTGVTIPDSVTTIGSGAFYDCTSLTSVTIPDSVRNIQSYAFYDCKSLVDMIIPNGVESIGSAAFQNCISLQKLTIPDSVKSIGEWAFNNCNLLKSVTIGNGVKKIGDYAFFGCSSLISVTIPDGVTKIGNFAFWQCKSLTSITISDSVNFIGENAFSKCASLKNVYYFGTVAEWNEITIGNNNEYILSASISYIGEYDSLINYRLRCTTAVVDGNLVLTANPAGTSSMKIRLGNIPEGATVTFASNDTNSSIENGIITIKNPGMKNLNVPMVITSKEGVKRELVLVADFGNAVRYATNARLSQSGNNLTVTSGNATSYILFDTRDIEGGYVEVSNQSRNLLGRTTVVGTSAVRFYNPVYDEGTATVTVKNANGEVVETYEVTMKFSATSEYTPLLDSSLRCTYETDGNTITVTADEGATNVYLIFGRYYAETLSANVNDSDVKKTGARTWRVRKSSVPVEFEVYFDASAYGGEIITRRIIVNFNAVQ